MKKSSTGLAMDGFVNNSSYRSGGGKVPKISDSSNLFKSSVVKSKLKSTAQSVHKRTQKSQTLMRGVVTKPASKQLKGSAEHKSSTKSQSSTVNTARNTRVQSITRHASVKRFGHIAPKTKTTQSSASKVQVGEVISRNTTSKNKADTKTMVPAAVPSMVTSVSHQNLERLLDEALLRADAHKKALAGKLPNQNIWQKMRRIPRWAKITTGVAILFVVATFYAWHNVPQVAVKVASTRANVNAQVPTYTPSGFSFAGPVSYEDGSVDIKFKANSDPNRHYTLTQENSNMANKSLADTQLPDDTQVQTSTVGGTKVYIYGENNDATWVNKGIQYTITDSAELNPDQLLKIAESL